ncbi:MAG: hypothetical protein ABFD50_03095 [Smithella sp.]
MDKDEIYRELEKDFSATFIEELIPGILHNFANPLNGIMGRSKLLQRRIEEFIKKVEDTHPDVVAGMADELQRIRTDIRAVNQESDSFFDMFKDVSGKFYAMAAKNEERINISQLLASEMRFADFYLDFKHEIKKKVQLDSSIPDFKGNTADLSLAFWRIMRLAMTQAKASKLKEFSIQTDHDDKYISVLIKSSINSQPVIDFTALMENLNSASPHIPDTVDQGVLLSLMLLDRYQAIINSFNEEGFNNNSISFPAEIKKN